MTQNKLNFRVAQVADIATQLDIDSVLDVGCRDCQAKAAFPEKVEYFGNDLFQNEQRNVAFVGDALSLDFGRKFDCVIALDIVEHVDDPYKLVDKLFDLSNRYVVISLPNVYDLSHRLNFFFKGTLGAKYKFGVTNSLDRHRWIMGYDEIQAFFGHYAMQRGATLRAVDIRYGEKSRTLKARVLGPLVRMVFGPKIITKTIVGVFDLKP